MSHFSVCIVNTYSLKKDLYLLKNGVSGKKVLIFVIRISFYFIKICYFCKVKLQYSAM